MPLAKVALRKLRLGPGIRSGTKTLFPQIANETGTLLQGPPEPITWDFWAQHEFCRHKANLQYHIMETYYSLSIWSLGSRINPLN